jgi:hypothetical protein
MYVVSLAILIAAMFIAAIIGMLTSDEILGRGGLGGSIVVLVLGYLQFVVVHTVLTLVLLFNMWKRLEDGVTPVTGGKAVGFLFIPFFNIYWFFRVWGGYPTEYNKYIERNRLSAPAISSGIFVGFTVTVILASVILVPILILPFVTVFLIARGCDAINNLELAKSAAAEHRLLSPADYVGTPENPRSKVPVMALAGVMAVGLMVFFGFSVFAWFNLNPKVSADLLPPTVGNFTLQTPGRVDGSFFGGKFRMFDNIYLSEAGGVRQAIRYNIFQYRSDADASADIASTCKSSSSTTSTTTASVLVDQQGKEAGHFCVQGGTMWMQIGRYFLWAHAPFGYDLEKLKAKEAPFESIMSFVKALPLTKNIVFDGQNASSTTTTTKTAPSTTSKTTTAPISSTADFTLTGKEFYDETNGSSASAKAKYKGKTVQISSRVAIASGDSVMLNAGGDDSIFAYFDAGGLASISKLQRDERVVVTCAVEADYSIKLDHCVLVENKGIIAPTDTPDVTFTADEYWNAIGSSSVSVSAKIKKENELSGKIIKITGKVKDLGGTKSYLAVGNDDLLACYPDEENKSMFSSLADGQSISFLAVGGNALSHCVVAAN